VTTRCVASTCSASHDTGRPPGPTRRATATIRRKWIAVLGRVASSVRVITLRLPRAGPAERVDSRFTLCQRRLKTDPQSSVES